MRKTYLPLIISATIALSACSSIDNHSSSPSFASATHNGQTRKAPAIAKSTTHQHKQTHAAAKQGSEENKDLAHKIQDSAKKVGTKISSAGSAIISVLSGH